MKDSILVAAVVLAFALLATVHVTIAAGLLRRASKRRALVAFVVAPLAPLFAWRAHMRVRAGLWAGAALLYCAALLAASA